MAKNTPRKAPKGSTLSLSSLEQLINIDSPTGFTDECADFIERYLRELGYRPERTRKGAVRCITGNKPSTIAIAAHFDTLGAIVDEIGRDGEIRVSQIGGYPPNSFEGAYVRLHASSNDRVFSGSFLLDNPSDHANREVGKKERTMKGMHVRIDERISKKEDVLKLGINVGDFVAFEPRYEVTQSGYIKSRFMDNKVGCYVLFEVASRLAGQKMDSRPSVELFFSSYEEVGHGSAPGFSREVEELLVIDMGVVGDGIPGDERSVSICAKDSSGPYDYGIRRKLTQLARQRGIPHHVSVYPYYASDGSAALAAGGDYRVGLIGPGVSASHGVERTHHDGVRATIDLTMAFIEDRAPKRNRR